MSGLVETIAEGALMVKTKDSGSSFIPAESFTESGFGRTSRPLTPKPGVGVRQLYASQLQHFVMNALREELAASNTTYPKAAAGLEGLTDARLSNIIVGRTVAPLADLIIIGRAYPRVGRVLQRCLEKILVPAAQESADR